MQPLAFRVEHLGFAARDPRALADWYLRVLGGRLVWQNQLQRPAVFVELPGGFLLEIYPATNGQPVLTPDNAMAGLRHLALRVGHIETARDQLQAAGVNFTETIKPAGGGGRVLFFRDPEENLLHLVERPAGEPLAHA